MNLHTITVGERAFNYCDHEVVMPSAVLRPMIELLDRWAHLAPKEPTYAMQKWGVPSLFVRFDGVLEDGVFHTYEIQDGCAWIGYAGAANKEFRKIRDDLVKNSWPPIKLLLPPADHHMWDDELWLEQITLKEALRSDDLLLIRRWTFFELNTEQRMQLIGRSVKSVFDQDSKEYGVKFGWWKYVFAADADRSLPWHEPFVLKPTKKFGSRDVMVWVPNEREGRSTRTQILETLRKHNSMFLQPLIPPMKISLEDGDYNMILRPFFAFDPRKSRWVPMGGLWTARPSPNFRIHGSSDAISGPLLIR